MFAKKKVQLYCLGKTRRGEGGGEKIVPRIFSYKTPLHSSAISKHICANIFVQCIDLQKYSQSESLLKPTNFAKHRTANQT